MMVLTVLVEVGDFVVQMLDERPRHGRR
jgi:hypothetical protein